MALTLPQALQYVKTHTGLLKSTYRNCAVSDFLGYRDWIAPPLASLQELQKTWALYLKYMALSGADHSYGSANGTLYHARAKKFWYTPGSGASVAPTLHAAKPNPMGLAVEAELKGVGQCEYFATIAYQALKAGGAAGTVPRVEKVSTPSHNWVLVNRSHAGDNQADWVAVDLWLLAMGVAQDKCICAWTNAKPQFGPPTQTITLVETFNPDNQA